MFNRLLPYLCFSAAIVWLTRANHGIDIAAKFYESKLVPDIIPEPPTKICQIAYKNIIVQTGEIITDLELKQRPNVTWEDADPNTLYTLYVAGLTNWTIEKKDPKDITPTTLGPETKQWHQWIQINIPGDRVNDGETLFPYNEIYNPPMRNVIDRYCFLVYKQPHRIVPPPPRDGKEYYFIEFCPPFQFFQNYSLTGPIAGNYFLTRIEYRQYKDFINRTLGYVY